MVGLDDIRGLSQLNGPVSQRKKVSLPVCRNSVSPDTSHLQEHDTK